MQPKQKFTTEQFLKLYNKRLNDQQIAKILNVSKSVIARKRYRLELIPINPRSNTNPTLSHQKLKENDKKQNQKPERKASKKVYFKRPEIKAERKAYNQTPEMKTKRKAYRQTPKGKIARRKAAKKHSQTTKGKITKRKANQKYSQTTKGKIARRKATQKYNQRKLKENPNYNKEQYKKRKIKKHQPS